MIFFQQWNETATILAHSVPKVQVNCGTSVNFFCHPFVSNGAEGVEAVKLFRLPSY